MRTGLLAQRKAQVAFASAFAILLLVGAFSYRAIAISTDSDGWVRHSHEVLENLEVSLFDIASIDASYRGFVLTGDESYVASYKTSVTDAQQTQGALHGLTIDNPEQQGRIQTLDGLLAQKVQFAQQVIDLRRGADPGAATAQIQSGHGQDLTAQFQAIVRTAQDDELRLLDQRTADAAASLDQTRLVLIIGTLLGLLITALAAWSVRRDSSRRGRAEAALRASDDKYGTLVQGIQDYAILMLGPAGEIASWNPGAARMTGRSYDEVIGQSFALVFSADDVKRGRPAEILRLAAEGGMYEEQGMRVRKDGSRFLVRTSYTALRDPDGALRGFSVISSDITENTESEAKYLGLLEAAPDAMVVVNQGGEIVLLNVQAEKQFGYRRDELLGQPVTNIIPEGFAERLIADDLRSAEDALAQQIGTGIELSARRKDGSEFPIELMLSPLDSAEGILVTAAIRDISVRTAAEADLQQKVEDLNRSNEELGQFAYLASHDLQEPLRMVASYTQLLSRRYKGKLDADADEFIAFAVDGASRMQRLIQDLLTFSRVGSRGEEMVDTSSEDALEQALTNLRGAIEDSGALVTHDPLPIVRADEMQLTQLFQNLVGNAIKYQNPEDAKVPLVHIAAARNGGKKWTFSVQDNGLGIDPQYFDRIFGMFQRLHKREEFAGTGIGLAICKKIVERHGGTISVESEPGHGSTFRFALAGSEGPP